METTRRAFVAGAAVAGLSLAGTAFADESDTETAAETVEGYSFYETESGLSVTVADDEDPSLPTVVVLATGGTIAGTGEAGRTTGYSAGQLDVGTLVDSAAGITEIANVRGAQVCNVASDNITDSQWLQIASTINELAQDDAISGFVITHGTDTLDETAYFLNLTVKTDKPVVVTGAMRPSTATSADGPWNLFQSIALAANNEAAGRGVMVVFSDGIFGARDVQKVSTFRTDAFNGRDFGALGYMLDEVPYFCNATTKSHTTSTPFDVTGLEELPSVAVAYFNIDADPGVLDYYVNAGAQGIVIAGAGAGSYSSLFSEAIANVTGAGIPVICCSRIGNGLVTSQYSEDSDSQAIGGNNLAPQKAATLLRLALTQTTDFAEIQDMVNTY